MEPASVLDDLLRPGLAVVFCGTRPGRRSAAAGAYYAGPGNRFWSTLAEIGLVDRVFAPADWRRLADHGIGLTDVAKTSAGPDRTIGVGDFDRDRLAAHIAAVAPRALAFNGKRAAGAALALQGRALAYGRQPEPMGSTVVFVLPSTSGAARGFWSIEPWRELAAFLSEATDA